MEDDYWRDEYEDRPPAAEPDHAARLAAKDAEIERLGKLSDYNIDQFNRAFEAQQAAEAALAAKDAEIERLTAGWNASIQNADNWIRRAEAAEADAARLREALVDARVMVEFWAGYASEYFQDKHDLARDLAVIDEALAATPAKEPTP